MNITFCIPIFNDWSSAAVLLTQLDRSLPSLRSVASVGSIRVLFVDDASSEYLDPAHFTEPTSIDQVSVLRLKRNLSHQRAIAIGLAHLQREGRSDMVVVMDGDGEDRPPDVSALLTRCLQTNCTELVFAERAGRSEGGIFLFGYACYRIAHRLLVGRSMRVGNFSVVPRACLDRLVSVSELWNHYAAAVVAARIPNCQIPIDRGERISGQSKMNLISLVVHGLSAISVQGEVVSVRVLFLLGILSCLLLVALAIVVGIRLGTDWAIPGWATSAVGFLILALLQLLLISVVMVILVLRGRSGSGSFPPGITYTSSRRKNPCSRSPLDRHKSLPWFRAPSLPRRAQLEGLPLEATQALHFRSCPRGRRGPRSDHSETS